MCKHHVQKNASETKQALHKLFAAYLHTVPLEELLEGVERARLDAKLRYVVIYGAACSYCLSRAERLEGSYLRAFALELKEQRAQTISVCSVWREKSKHEPLSQEIYANLPF